MHNNGGGTGTNWYLLSPRHIKRTVTNGLFADGHCESMRTDTIPLRWSVDAEIDAQPFPKVRLDR